VIASLGVAFGVGLLTVSASCIAAPLSLVIAAESTPAAVDCADSEGLLGKVERIAQRALAPKTPDAEAIRVVIQFDRSQGQYSAELVFHGPKPGERSLRDRSDRCEPLEDAVAVAIALLLDREIERRERELTEAPRAVTTIKIVTGRVEPRPFARGSVFLALEAGAQAGFNATAAPSAALAFGVRLQRGWLVESSAWTTLPAARTFGTGEVTLSLVAGTLRACHLWGHDWQWGPCAGVAVGRLHGSGRGFDESMSSSLLWSAVGGSVLLQRSLGERWELGLHALAWLPLKEQRFAVQNLGVAWSSAAVEPGLSVRLGFRFR